MLVWFTDLITTMSRPVKVALVLFGIVAVIGAQAAGMTIYMNNLQERVATVEVVRAKLELPPHKLIDEKDLEIVRVRVQDAVKGYIRSIDEVVGKEVQEPLAEREQITPRKIGRAVKKEGEITIEIPAAWIMSFPQSLRSWDTIAIWDVIDPSKIKDVKVEGSVNSTTAPPSQLDNQTNQNQANQANQVNMNVQLQVKANTGIPTSSEPLIEGITVAYFKDSAANDVKDSQAGATPRISASAVGAKVEVNVTPEQFGKLREKANQNYKFIIGYK